MSHIPNKEQEKAFKTAVNALKKCRDLGLRVYAKQYELIAYTKEADIYADSKCPLHKMANFDDYGNIPHLCGQSILSDSGADDYAFYISLEDKELFNPDDY
jgi:hypothetical protein